MPSIWSNILKVGILLAILAVLGVSIVILIKVNKNNDKNDDSTTLPSTAKYTFSSMSPSMSSTTVNYSTTTNNPTNYDCIKKSTLPQATDNSTFDPFSWGSYRGQLYFGMQTRHPLSPRFGILWRKRNESLRYWCDHSDGVEFMWMSADGQTFGEQPIVDGNLKFTTQWINQAHSFAAKVTVDPTTNLQNKSYSLIFYLSFQDTNSFFQSAKFTNFGAISEVFGTFSQLGKFSTTFSLTTENGISQAFLADTPFVEMATVKNFLERFQSCDSESNCKFTNTSTLPFSNLFAVQVDFTKPISALFQFKIDSDPNMPDFDTTLTERKLKFNQKFDQVFPINATDVAAQFKDMGKAALSNMLGSISYWHGYSNATGSCLPKDQTVEYGPLDLIAGEPSRPDFPRGFLWDDGFHNLLIRQFDPDLSLQV